MNRSTLRFGFSWAAVVAASLLAPIAETFAVDTNAEAKSPFVLRLVPLLEGHAESAFGGDPARFRQSAAAQAAERAGVDLMRPAHPLVIHQGRDGRLYYLFYNVIEEGFGPAPYLIQRVKKTVTEESSKDDPAPRTSVTYLVEVIKLRQGAIPPDQHFGSYSIQDEYRRVITKEIEIGYGQVPGIAEGREWPFAAGSRFKLLQDYAESRELYDQVEFTASQTWTIRAMLARDGSYAVQVPELGIDAPDKLPDATAARPHVDPESAAIVLDEGRGLADVQIGDRQMSGIRVGESRTADLRRVLGEPLAIEAASAKADNFHYPWGLTFNVYRDGTLNTILTRPGFAGQTARGIKVGDERARVVDVYDLPAGNPKSEHLTAPGVIFQLGGDQRVQRIVIFAAR
jgi:hypothetical protein